ncbi:MAG: GTP-binding protein [Planctomycetota bacterium]
MAKTRFCLIGGFLGAGKTTLIGQLARRYQSQGKTVAIVTNDQADDLVDTMNLRSQGFDVGEVSGACFCCSFDNLVDTAQQLIGKATPDVILAEPVGSCTDLVATVVLPMQQLLGAQFELASFGVLLKPSHGRRILGQTRTGNSGFSAQAEYIFRKQLEEADYLMLGRQDQMNESDREHLTALLNAAAPGVPVLAVSPATGYGVDAVLEQLESRNQAARRLLEIDYDIYAVGEAELGWVNLSAQMTVSGAPVALDAVSKSLVQAIADACVEHGEIAHLKASLSSGDTRSVANVVSNDSPVDLGLSSDREVSEPIDVIVNARVAMDPDLLLSIVSTVGEQVAEQWNCGWATQTSHALRPGRPTPTHRVGSL